MPIFRFSNAALRHHRAHSGTGEVLAARVLERQANSALNFIDLVEIPPGVAIGEHRHSPHDEEIYIVIEGTGEMLIDGRRETAAPGDVILNPAGGTHGMINLGHQTIRLVVIDISTDGSAFRTPTDLP